MNSRLSKRRTKVHRHKKGIVAHKYYKSKEEIAKLKENNYEDE